MRLCGVVHQCVAEAHRGLSDSVAQEKANGFCNPTRFLQTSPTSVRLGDSAVDKQPLPGPGCAGGRSHDPSCPSPAASEVAHMTPPSVFLFTKTYF